MSGVAWAAESPQTDLIRQLEEQLEVLDRKLSEDCPVRLFAAMAPLHAIVLQRLVDGGPLQELDQSERGIRIGGVLADRRLNDSGHLQLRDDCAQIFERPVGNDLA